MQRDLRVEGHHINESFLVAPSLEGTLVGWGWWEMLLAADNQLSHRAWSVASF